MILFVAPEQGARQSHQTPFAKAVILSCWTHFIQNRAKNYTKLTTTISLCLSAVLAISSCGGLVEINPSFSKLYENIIMAVSLMWADPLAPLLIFSHPYVILRSQTDLIFTFIHHRLQCCSLTLFYCTFFHYICYWGTLGFCNGKNLT